MPELPEVITISRDLHKEAINKKIVNIISVNKYRPDNVSNLQKHVKNSTVLEVSNIAKLITIKLSNNNYIASHLNMSGRLLWNKEDGYSRIIIEFDSGDKLHYSDTRMFGYFEPWEEQKVKDYSKKYAKVAIDPSLTLEEFITGLKRSNTNIKNNLLNQKFVGGIGNIYANDALHMSKIHPKRKTHSISDIEYKLIFDNVKQIINEGIEHRGSTIDRYSDLYGNPGSHQNHFRIYGMRTGNCKICNTKVTFEKIQGRGSFYCENCQPLNPKSVQKSLF